MNVYMKEHEVCDNLTDEQLVEKVRGNAEAFVYIINRYTDRLFRYIRRMTNVEKEEAEDILQETFIKTYIHINDFDNSLKFSSWIYRIARNQVISDWRKRKIRPQSDSTEHDDKLLNIGSELNLEEEVDRDIFEQHIREVLNHLDKKYKDVLILRFLEEKNYKEISDILKKPEGTVATLLNRAKKQCKRIIEKKSIQF
ncbi:MAG: RNA polymerase sigma factor [Candidatus Magasanikbacteria bacterium]